MTRDSVAYWGEYGLQLQGYAARQSLISAYSPAATANFSTHSVRPPFLRRMVEGDIRGDLRRALADTAKDCDVLLWDITDERNGVLRVPSGGYVTHLAAYRSAYVGSQPLGAPVQFGSDLHYSLWCTAVDEFILDLDANELRSSTIVNACPWAVRFDDGESTARPNTRGPDAFNTNARRYYQYLHKVGLKIAHPKAGTVTAYRDHQWGPAPYHYTEESYRSALDAITVALRN